MAIFMAILPGMAESSYSITFKSNSNTSDGNPHTTSTAISTIVEEGAEYLSKVTAASNTYLGKKPNGMKVGKSGSAGNITFALSDKGKVKATKIVVNAARYNDSKAVKLNVNDAGNQDLTSATFSDYTYQINDNITELKFATTNFSFVKSVTVYYDDGGAGDTQAAPGFVTITPASGTIDTNTAISIAADPAANPAATITYTIDGDVEQTYSAPFTLPEGKHIIVATATNSEGSVSTNATYTVTAPVVVPGFNDILINTNFTNMGYDAAKKWTANKPATSTQDNSGATYEAKANSNSGFQMRTSRGCGVTVSEAPEGCIVSEIEIEMGNAGGGVSVYTSDKPITIPAKNASVTNATLIQSGIKTKTTVSINAPYFIIVPTNDSYTVVSKATVKWVSTGPAVPADPVFSVAEGDVEYNTQVTVKSEGATSLTYMIEYDEADKKSVSATIKSDSFTFNVDYDCQVTVVGTNDAGDSKEVSALYYVIRPTVTFDPAAGEIAKGTKVKFSAPNATKYVYSVFTPDLETTLVDEATVEGEFGEYTVSQDATISVKAYLPNGYAKIGSDDAEYTVVIPADPTTPTFSIADGSAVTPGTKVTIHSANAQKLAITEYSITGHPMEPIEIEGDTYTITIDRMHRRFSAVGRTADALFPESAAAEAFYNLKGKAASDGTDSYALLTSIDDLQDGMEFIIADSKSQTLTSTGETYYKVMGRSNWTKYDNNWKGYNLVYAGDDLTEITEEQIANKQATDNEEIWILKLEKADADNRWYLLGNTGTKENPEWMYFTPEISTLNDKSLELHDEGVPATISFTEDGTFDINFDVAFENDRGKNENTHIKYNTSSYLFACYHETSTFRLPRLYGKKAASEAIPVEPYQMTYTYTQGAPAAKGARAAAATTGTDLDMEAAADNDINGIHTFTLTGVENVMGEMSVTIPDGANGGQKLMGHMCEENYVEKNFHQSAATAGCTEEHSPIVFVESKSPITLTHAESPEALPITTNPNEYHGFYINHPKADVTVELNPFKSAKLTFIGEEIPTGIEGVDSEGAEAGEETFYNLQGVRVEKANMMPGIYVRVVGTTATKVVVR